MQNRGYSNSVELVNIATLLTSEITFANATSIFTANGHGLRDHDVVRLSNSGGALPDGLLATINYYVQVIDANTFYLYTDSAFATLATAVDDGSGTNSYVLQSRKMNVTDYRSLIVQLNTAGNANFTVKCQGAANKVSPEFANAASATNPWTYVQMIDTDDGDTKDGSVGVGPTGTDINKQYEVNINGLDWICFDFTSVTAGKAQILVNGYDNN